MDHPSGTRKRPLDDDEEEAFVPQEDDLTFRRLDEWIQLSDRQKICWALQTETRLRLSKVKNRHQYEANSTSLAEGDYLFPIYPEIKDNGNESSLGISKSVLARDASDFQRKRLAILQNSRAPDESWSSLTPITIRGYEQA